VSEAGTWASYTTDKGLITRIYKELKKLNSPKISDSIKKWATEIIRAVSKKEVKWLKTHEKMLTIPGHKGNANQNHIKILPYSG
jgi:ribonucleotide reductase beta subunit family protein with ferritin-like domain